MSDRIAENFLSVGIQHWGQTAKERADAKDEYLKAAGFVLEQDRTAAEEWLKSVIRQMPWGKYEREADFLRLAIEQRKAA